MAYHYVRLTGSDVLLFKELLAVFGETFAELETYQGKVPSDAYLCSLLEKDTFIALVALEEGRVVGGLAGYVLEKFEQERKEIFVYDLAVLAAHRRRGIATTLIGKLRQVAREIGAHVIFVQADRGDTPAIRLYESLGRLEETYNFDIDVD